MERKYAQLFFIGILLSVLIITTGNQDVLALHDSRHHEVMGEKCSTAYELAHPKWTAKLGSNLVDENGIATSFETEFTGDNPLPLCSDLLAKHNITTDIAAIILFSQK
ncbi:hypothetical protein BH23THE1_BH23THE1_27550 [soil metagenome]